MSLRASERTKVLTNSLVCCCFLLLYDIFDYQGHFLLEMVPSRDNPLINILLAGMEMMQFVIIEFIQRICHRTHDID
jgi:hypothetical protein